ncbi:MAG: hypothetical protein FIA92_13525 [Chloroflexi bacterium]|nr:hypothetical protein [Chloroflexota bacterium]
MTERDRLAALLCPLLALHLHHDGEECAEALFAADRLLDGRVTITPQPDKALREDKRPRYVLRLTGEQIESINPPPDGDWFTDWDEYEDFVPRRMLTPCSRPHLSTAPEDVERLARALYEQEPHTCDPAFRNCAAAIAKAYREDSDG